ncbi:MAG: Uma2 family endonuclease [Methylococcaceae bacterium]
MNKYYANLIKKVEILMVFLYFIVNPSVLLKAIKAGVNFMGKPSISNLPHYLWKDYLSWEGNWELIDGIPYAMSPAPSLKHQGISQKIAVQLEMALTHCQQCQALLPVDWKIDEDTVVQPDNLIVCGEIEGNFLTRAPRLIVEILSLSTAKKDKTTKYHLYEREGVLFYLIVDPENKLVTIYDILQGHYVMRLETRNESVEFDLGGVENCNIKLDFSKIWV